MLAESPHASETRIGLHASRIHRLTSRVVWRTLLVVPILAALAAGGFFIWRISGASRVRAAGLASVPTKPRADRLLVIIVPGTHGNENFWPVISPGNVTFGSEVQRGAGSSADVYPFLWSAPNEQTERMQAAHNLAAIIDDKAAHYARICLVGHSYGGDVALCAAGLCRHPVDVVVCLSTPHLYLIGATPGGDVVLPVYCTAAARKNIRRIITLCPSIDRVPDRWADVQKGIAENDAIGLAHGWLESTGFPRLKEDGWLRDLGFANNLDLSRSLNMADDNIAYLSKVPGMLAPHYAVHSRRMGYMIGQMLAAGASDASVDYLREILQPADADWGEPIPQAAWDAWLRAHKADFACAGHLLRQIDLRLWGRHDSVDPYFKLCAADGKHVIATTPSAHGRAAEFKPGWLLMSDQRERLDLWDSNFFSDDYIGNEPLNGAGPMPAEVNHPGKKHHWSWCARLDWQAVHY